MALSTATITFDIADQLGNDFDPRRTKVWVTTNVDGDTIIDTSGNKIRLGSGNVTLNADGTGSIVVWVPGADANPESWQTTVHIDYPDRNEPRGRGVVAFGPFTITTNADLADLVEEQAVPPTYLSTVTEALDGYVDSAAAAATAAAASATSAAASAALATEGGAGVPDGGLTGQALVKASNTNGDVEWGTIVGGGEGADGLQLLIEDDITGYPSRDPGRPALFVGDTDPGPSGTDEMLDGDAWYSSEGTVTATSIAFTPTGSIAATNVQAAIAEVAAEAGTGGGSAFVGAKAIRSASYGLVTGNATAVPWDAEEYDTDGFHSNASNNNRLTVPTGKAGKYQVSATIGSDQAFSADRFLATIRKNGTAVRGGNVENCYPNSGTYPMIQVTADVDLAEGDYVDVMYFHTSAADRNMYNAQCAFALRKIG